MLTQLQRDALRFIADSTTADGICPSFQDISDHLSLNSKGGVSRLVGELVKRGFLRRMENKARALEVIRLPADREDRWIPDDDLLGMLSEMLGTAQVMGEYDETMDIRVDRGLWETVTREIEDRSKENGTIPATDAA